MVWAGAKKGLPGVAKLRLSDLRLPEGMSLWSASPMGMQAAELTPGASLEMFGDAADTLAVWVAPTGSWKEGDPIPGLGPRPGRLRASFAAATGGGELHIDLPEAAGLRAAVHTAAGRRLALVERARLAPGHHVFRVAADHGALPRGLLLVTIELPGSRRSSRLVLKSVLP